MILVQLVTFKRIQEKEIERDSFEVQISAIDVTGIDDRERNLVTGCSPLQFSKVEVYLRILN